MKSKKLIAMGLAVVMTLALCVPALAEDTVITGMYKEIQIDVDIPTVGTAVINPYGMPVKAMYKPATGDAEELGALTTAGKIATQPLIGVSTCEVALDVGATVTGTPKGNLILANKDISTLKTNSAVVYLECKQDTTLDKTNVATAGSEATEKPISGIIGADAVAAFNAWESSTYNFGTDDAAKAANADKILVSESGATKLALCTLAAAKDNAGTMEPQAGSFLLARLGGDVVQSPLDAWTAADGVVVNVAFTFTPAAPKAGADFTVTAADAAAPITLKADLPAGVTAVGTATYKWELVDGGTAKVGSIKTGDEVKQTANFYGLDAAQAGADIVAGKFTAKCTVSDDTGIQYVTVQEITVT